MNENQPSTAPAAPDGAAPLPPAIGPGSAGPSSALTDSAAGRLAGALVAPGKTFESIARRPTWALALVLNLVLGVVLGTVVVQHMDMGATVRQQLERSGRSLPPEQVEQQIAMAEKVSKVMGSVGPLLWVPILYTVVAGLFWLLLRLVGGEIRFPVSLSVALHGMLPQILSNLLSVPVVASHGTYSPVEMQRGNFLASNLAFLAPEGASPVVMAALGSIDLFSLWSLTLLVIGYRRAARISTAAAAAVVVGAWLVYVLGKIALAAAFGR